MIKNFFQIVSAALTIIVYPYALYILQVERHKLLPSVPPNGHGIVLLGFWTLAFIADNLVFVNLFKREWWFKFET